MQSSSASLCRARLPVLGAAILDLLHWRQVPRAHFESIVLADKCMLDDASSVKLLTCKPSTKLSK